MKYTQAELLHNLRNLYRDYEVSLSIKNYQNLQMTKVARIMTC